MISTVVKFLADMILSILYWCVGLALATGYVYGVYQFGSFIVRHL